MLEHAIKCTGTESARPLVVGADECCLHSGRWQGGDHKPYHHHHDNPPLHCNVPRLSREPNYSIFIKSYVTVMYLNWFCIEFNQNVSNVFKLYYIIWKEMFIGDVKRKHWYVVNCQTCQCVWLYLANCQNRQTHETIDMLYS